MPIRDGEQPVRQLGPLEQQVMEIAWRDQNVTVADVVRALRPQTASAYTTVMTVMTRLAQKGLLAREARGRAYMYQPTMSPQSYEEALARDRVRSLIAEFGDVAVAQFAEQLRDVDPERARRLGELLRRRSRG